MQDMTPFEAAYDRLSALAENLARADAVNKLIEDLMEEERHCTLPISGSVIAVYESKQYEDAVTALKIVATMDAMMGISA
jgi:hypothetical protein